MCRPPHLAAKVSTNLDNQQGVKDMRYFFFISVFVLLAPTLIMLYFDEGLVNLIFLYNITVLFSAGLFVLFVNEAIWKLLELFIGQKKALSGYGTVCVMISVLHVLQYFFLAWIRKGICISSSLVPFVFSNINLAIFSLWSIPRLFLLFLGNSELEAKKPQKNGDNSEEKVMASVRLLQSIVAFERQKNYYHKRIIRDRFQYYDGQLRRVEQQLIDSPNYSKRITIRPYPMSAKWSLAHLQSSPVDFKAEIQGKGTLSQLHGKSLHGPSPRSILRQSDSKKAAESALSQTSSAHTLIGQESPIAKASIFKPRSSFYTNSRINYFVKVAASPYRMARKFLYIFQRVHFNCLVICGYLWTLASTYVFNRERDDLRPFQLVGS